MTKVIPFSQRFQDLQAISAALEKSKIKIKSVQPHLDRTIIAVEGIPPLLGDCIAVVGDGNGKRWRIYEHKFETVSVRWQRPWCAFVQPKKWRVH